ncbi:NAD(P)-dependent dehydrogenase (short-subunit alcohol dehydrogenase family) [Sphingomonas sp. BE270]|jgi:NAD(P)-dependent dehydrogenase (short-subunit alcohol dehydrogenase family)|uniref:SDR family oxidoreductase n=1 Tax=Sphingomonas sp. BE270 TaxID=2817726 RepID=UPI0028598569|nr:SDR family oxidoreductase [Sphingomonas sp. BE270]MDR7260048.1 NAD(P)-dependent dehydrogenase (short-subunit alcohol dehydrogenase family) [Sphingomonas sp. BE270]
MVDLERRGVLMAAAAGAATASVVTPALAAETGSSPAVSRDKPLAGKVAFITGGARGIGRATAVELARRGANIALVDIAKPDGVSGLRYRLSTPEDLAESVRLVEAEGVRALSFQADTRDAAALAAAAKHTAAVFGGIDFVAAIAGIWMPSTLAEGHVDAWRNQYEINVIGVLNSAQAAMPHLRKPGARFVTINSMRARLVSDIGSAYAASKWAVTALMKSLALALGPDGVTANAIAPAMVDTPLLHGGAFAGLTPQQEDKSAREVHVLPVGVMPPETIAGVVAFLFGPEGANISGATIDVNAGRSSTFAT